MKTIKTINIIRLKYVALVLTCLLSFTNRAVAQAQDPCHDNSLNISTGAIENRNPANPFIAAHRQDVLTQGLVDKHWKISNLTPLLSTLYGITVFPADAKIVPCGLRTSANPPQDISWELNNVTTSAVSPGCAAITAGLPNLNWPESHWISSPDVTVPGFFWPHTASSVLRAYVTTFKREFRVCQAGQFAFNIVIACDNYCDQVRVDGVPVTLAPYIPQSPGNIVGHYSMFNHINNTLWFAKSLGIGTHNIEFDIVNENVSGDNPHGFNLTGTIWETSNASALVNDFNPACDDICSSQPEPCSDDCFWKLTGNNINTIGHNIFGTRNNQDIHIASNRNGCSGMDRGIITAGGSYATDPTAGRFGWGTTVPTARFHVNCVNGNPDNDPNPTASDIRFENLEQNPAGKILSIDANGYVFNTGVDITNVGGVGTAWNLTGNSAIATDWLGTSNLQDLRIRVNNRPSVLVKSGTSVGDLQAGFVGINTTSPTARLHVECNSGNENNGLSDVRFDHLEPLPQNTTYQLLGIDPFGYVFNTQLTLPTTTTIPNSWDLGGNTLTTNKNFGTISAHDVNIITSGSPRGVFDKDGNFGWHLSGTPTTSLHVDAANPANPMAPSGIRFENLPLIDGELIVVDPQGYVFNTGIKSDDVKAILGDGGDLGMMKQKIDDLEKQIVALKATVANNEKSDKIIPDNGNELYQNNPNPFGTETSIGFNIVKMQQSAFIAIYDLNGRELYKYAVTAKGKGSVAVSGEKLVPGQYLYSLIVDGREEATKKMVVSK